jgi:hypothetical protein
MDPLKLKPQDKLLGGILALLAAGAIGYGLWLVLPILIALAANTIIFVAEIMAICILLMVFANPKTWQTLYYGYMNLIHSARHGIVAQNPIGVLDTVIDRYNKKLAEIDTYLKNSQAARKRIENKITSRDGTGALQKAETERRLAATAERDGQPRNIVALHATQAERWDKVASTLQPYVEMLRNAQDRLEQARDYVKIQIADSENRRETLRVQLDGLLEGQNSAKALKKVFSDNVDLQMEKLAIEEIERQSTEAEAEIDQFITSINPVLEENDLKRKSETEAAMARFDAYLRGEKPAAPALPAAPVVDGVLVEPKKEMVRR